MGRKLIFIDFFYFFFLTKQNICVIPVDWQKKVPSQKPELSFLKVHGHNTPKNTKIKKEIKELEQYFSNNDLTLLQ